MYQQPQRADETDEHYSRRRFADPGGRSALHPGHRCYPCPTCHEPNRLTRADMTRHYQCDACADIAEGGAF